MTCFYFFWVIRYIQTQDWNKIKSANWSESILFGIIRNHTKPTQLFYVLYRMDLWCYGQNAYVCFSLSLQHFWWLVQYTWALNIYHLQKQPLQLSSERVKKCKTQVYNSQVWYKKPFSELYPQGFNWCHGYSVTYVCCWLSLYGTAQTLWMVNILDNDNQCSVYSVFFSRLFLESGRKSNF